MTRLILTLACFVCAGIAQAQDAAPTVRTFHTGANQLMSDVEYLLSLTNKTEQAQWDRNIKDNIIIFLDGVERAQPMRIDLILSEKGLRYRPSFPVDDPDLFLSGIKLNGIQYRRRAKDYYSLSGAFEGLLRIKGGYANFAEESEDIPPNMPDPRTAIEPLAKVYTVGLDVDNTPDGQRARQQAFEEVRGEMVAAMKPLANESENEYARRKLLFEHRLDTAERLFVDAKEVTAGFKLDHEAGRGRLEMVLSALPGTSLDTSIQAIAASPSLFAHIARPEAPILSGRINFPLDDLRKKQAEEFYALVKPQLLAEFDADEGLTDDEKAAARDATEKVFAMLEAGREAGIVDGFVDTVTSEGGNTMIGAIRAVDGTQARAIVELLPKIRSDAKVELDVETVGDVAIHRIKPSAEISERFYGFFGSDPIVYVGTGPNAVWGGVGPQGLELMKGAIEAKPAEGDAAPSPAFLEVLVKFAPWLELRDKRAAPDSGDVVRRKRAIEAFADGEGQLALTLEHENGRIEGVMLVDRGILRLVGKEIAAFARENLE